MSRLQVIVGIMSIGVIYSSTREAAMKLKQKQLAM